MSTLTVESIKDAIRQLPEAEQASLASWLTVHTMDAWDQEMQEDFSPGGLAPLF
jgi:hypothetical protein